MSGFAIGGQLGPRDDSGKLHPVALFSKKLNNTRMNYPIHDKELLAIVEAFQEWRLCLSGTTYEVQVYIDHKTGSRAIIRRGIATFIAGTIRRDFGTSATNSRGMLRSVPGRKTRLRRLLHPTQRRRSMKMGNGRARRTRGTRCWSVLEE